MTKMADFAVDADRLKAQTQTEEDDELIIDVPLLLETSDDSKDTIYSEWSKCCIYRVPKKLRSVKEEAYTPQLVSIGPFHHGKPELKPMELVKSRYFHLFCRRTAHTRDDFRSVIDEKCEKDIKACYAGTFQITTGFADMVITDAGFIIELLLRSLETHEDDYICNKPWLAKSVELDLILLENQLPFFVLEKIFNFAFSSISKKQDNDCSDQIEIKQNETKMTGTGYKFSYQNEQESKDFKDQSKKSRTFCSNCCFTRNCREGEDEDDGSILSSSAFLKLTRQFFSKREHHLKYKGAISGVLHFTDLLRYYYCPPGHGLNFEQRMDSRLQNLRSATKLDEAGINFEAVEKTYLNNIKFRKARLLKRCPCFNCSWLLKCLPCFFDRIPDLKCQEPTLKLPRLEVDDTTECLFRNLMAFEQCHYPNEVYICNYVWLMDKLINTQEDVEHLIDKKVIVDFLGSSKAVAELFNSLCKQIVEQKSCYYQCVEDIVDHCNNPLNRIMATLTSVYFRDFWRGTATVVGIIVLVLTVWNFARRFLK